MSVSPQNSYPIEPEQAAAAEHWTGVYAVIEALELDHDLTTRAQQVSGMTGQGLMHVARSLHSALAPGLSHDATTSAMHIQSPDGANRMQLALPEERQGLFDMAASLVQALGAKARPGEEEAYLRRAGNITALALVLAHPFEDANGRTARTLAHIIRDGYQGQIEEQDDIQTVGSNRPTKGFKINSFLPTKNGKDLSPSELLAVAASLDIPLVDRESYEQRKDQNFVTPYPK